MIHRVPLKLQAKKNLQFQSPLFFFFIDRPCALLWGRLADSGKENERRVFGKGDSSSPDFQSPAVPGAPAGGGPGELAKYGLPGVAQLKSRASYVLCYDPRTRGALWVVEQLRPEGLRGDGDRSSCDFHEDESVHAYHRATNADYRGSGFDRGHLAAAANHRWSQKAMDDTFYLSNVAPQVTPAPPPATTPHPGGGNRCQRSYIL